MNKNTLDLVKDFEVHYIGHMGTDERVVEAARVSYTTGTTHVRNMEGLINYLMKHKHMTPFEHCQLTLFIQCDMATAFQIFRHRVFSFNMESRRYSEVDEGDFYVPEKGRLFKQDAKKKQCSSDELVDNPDEVLDLYLKASHDANTAYNKLLELGLAREVARNVLPIGTKTRFYMSGSLRNWLGFCLLRSDWHAQAEVRAISLKVEECLKHLWPVSYEAWRQSEKLADKTKIFKEED